MLKARTYLLASFLATTLAIPAIAEPEGKNVIAEFGRPAIVADAGVLPDPALDYRIIMSVSKPDELGNVLVGLDRAARFVNLIARSGVSADHRHIVVVLYGPAIMAALRPEARGRRNLPPSADTELIAGLVKAGVSIHVCGQTMAAARVSPADLNPAVTVDLSAMTTITTFQLRGYKLLPE